MNLYRWQELEKQILIYAESTEDAIRYLDTWPLFWHLKFKPEQFVQVAAPKGPSPSVLMYKLETHYHEQD